jgi:hypothetical protein
MYNDVVHEAYAVAQALDIAVPEEHVQTVILPSLRNKSVWSCDWGVS